MGRPERMPEYGEWRLEDDLDRYICEGVYSRCQRILKRKNEISPVVVHVPPALSWLGFDKGNPYYPSPCGYDYIKLLQNSMLQILSFLLLQICLDFYRVINCHDILCKKMARKQIMELLCRKISFLYKRIICHNAIIIISQLLLSARLFTLILGPPSTHD